MMTPLEHSCPGRNHASGRGFPRVITGRARVGPVTRDFGAATTAGQSRDHPGIRVDDVRLAEEVMR
jgi:hypothetical protein